jgi:hypothetical protein
MRERGYRDPTHDEAFLYTKLGERMLKIIHDTAFRYAHWESLELGITPENSQYRTIQKIDRVQLTTILVDTILKGEAEDKEILEFRPATDYQMKMDIKNKYSSPLDQSVRANLPLCLCGRREDLRIAA